MSIAYSAQQMAAKACEIRQEVVAMSHRGRAPHLGSSLSCIDILVAAYFSGLRLDPAAPDAADRDRFILSKGHAAAAWYATLAHRGFFDLGLLETYNKRGSPLPEQPSPNSVPGIEAATGSLGHGLAIGLGMAVSGRIQDRNYRVVVVLSDGECNEGAVWESALFAAANRLEQVLVIVDYNGWQATGRSDEILALASLQQKWQAFGWSASEVDGHDVGLLAERISASPVHPARPTALIARTIKGKGVSFMEDDNNWHYRIPDADELQRAQSELAAEKARFE